MKTAEKSPLNKPIKNCCQDYGTFLILGAATGLALTAALLYRSKKQKSTTPESSPSNTPNLNMERYVFELPTAQGPKTTIVESSGECYSVKLNNKFLGTMWQDPDNGMRWQTTDEKLWHYLPDIAAALSGAFSRKGYPTILKGAYPEIIHTEWKTAETLEVTVNDKTDLELFTTFLKDEALNLVDFEEHLDLVIKKPDNPYFKIIGIN